MASQNNMLPRMRSKGRVVAEPPKPKIYKAVAWSVETGKSFCFLDQESYHEGIQSGEWVDTPAKLTSDASRKAAKIKTDGCPFWINDICTVHDGPKAEKSTEPLPLKKYVSQMNLGELKAHIFDVFGIDLSGEDMTKKELKAFIDMNEAGKANDNSQNTDN